jgi:hypothetical protein
MNCSRLGSPKSVHEVPLTMKYWLSDCAGFSTCDGPQFCALPVVPCDQEMIGRPPAGAGPVGATSRPVETVFLSFRSEET